jgi:threonine dehydratase
LKGQGTIGDEILEDQPSVDYLCRLEEADWAPV